jgi:hypothetical protein
MRKSAILAISILMICLAGYAQEDNPRPPSAQKSTAAVVYGKISKIDRTDPSIITIELVDSRSGKTRVIEAPVAIDVAKITDTSELKPGDNARIFTKSIGDKELAITIIFGKTSETIRQSAAAAKK